MNAQQQAAIQTLRQQILSRWGNTGDWNQGGIDRATELASLLAANGVTDLSQANLAAAQEVLANPNPVGYVEGEGGGSYSDGQATTRDRLQLNVSGRNLGFLGDFNKDGTVSGMGAHTYLDTTDSGQGGSLGWSSTGKGAVTYVADRGPNGELVIRPEWASTSDMGDVRTVAKMIGSALAANYFMPGTPGSEFMDLGAGVPSGIPGWDNAFLNAGGQWAQGFAPAAAGFDGGGDFLDALQGGSGAPDMPRGFDLSNVADAAGFDILSPGAISSTLPAAAGTAALGAGSFGTPLASGGSSSWWDRLTNNAGNFFSDPGNILRTIGTVGSIAEGLRNNEGSGDFTQTTTRTLDPRINTAIFGADGNSGLLGDLMAWKNQNPTGQNQTMRDAQAGMRGLLTDPRIMDGYWQMGGAGLGLIGQGIAPNPWKPRP